MRKVLISVIILFVIPLVALALDRGWVLFKDKAPTENLADASNLLARINSYFPQTSKYSGKVFPYWMSAPAEIKQYIAVTNVTTNIIDETEEVVTNVTMEAVSAGWYLIYVRPSIYPLLSTGEQAQVTAVLPEGYFISE